MSKKTVFTAILIFNLMFIVPGIAVTILMMVSSVTSTVLQVAGVITLIALLFALLYTLKGFSKKQAWAHKLFLLFSILAVLSLCWGTAPYHSVFYRVIAAIAALLLLALLLGKNLGFRKSIGLCAVLIAVYVVLLLRVILTDPNIGAAGDPASNLLMNSIVAALNLSVLTGTITFSKYVDKIERGRTV